MVAAKKHCVDLLIVSEPNVKLVRGNSGWITDTRLDVAIRVLNRSVKLRTVTRSAGFIVVTLEDSNCILATYISPNIRPTDFSRRLDEIMRLVEGGQGEWLVMGDFNSKSAEWGSPVTDYRGREVGDWIAALDLTIHNDGRKPTCVTANGESYIDLTLSTAALAGKVRNWRVKEDLTMSDHQHIHFKLMAGTDRRGATSTWEERRFPDIDYTRARSELADTLELLRVSGEISHEVLLANMKTIQKKYTGRNGEVGRTIPYWWTEEIGEQRAACVASRRAWLRARRRDENGRGVEEAKQRLAENKKILSRSIRRSKRASWRELCQRLEEDMWGQAYKIATRQLRGLRPTHDIPEDVKIEIVRQLFPAGERHHHGGRRVMDPPPFTADEIERAAENLRTGTSPGMDGVTPQTVKNCVRDCSNLVTEVMNDILRRQEFPRGWKVARVVLISKEEDGGPDGKRYRPICLLGVLAKLYESAIRDRLVGHLEGTLALSEQQYGFRKGRSTIPAIERVCSASRRLNGRWVVMVLLDVKNAFNCASWPKIMEKLADRDTPEYLLNVVADYLEDRAVMVGKSRLEVTAGVPQGSVLGPTLWNAVLQVAWEHRMTMFSGYLFPME